MCFCQVGTFSADELLSCCTHVRTNTPPHNVYAAHTLYIQNRNMHIWRQIYGTYCITLSLTHTHCILLQNITAGGKTKCVCV